MSTIQNGFRNVFVDSYDEALRAARRLILQEHRRMMNHAGGYMENQMYLYHW